MISAYAVLSRASRPTVMIESITGPKTDFYYFGDLPLEVDGRYVLNRVALSSGGEFASMQEDGRANRTEGPQW